MISIIIPCYNSSQYITETLLSIFNQTSDDYELLIIDDGSTDNTVEIIKELCINKPNVKLILKKNSGVSSTRNIGILNSNGSHVLFLDSDDTLNDNTIKKINENIYDNDILLYGFVYHKNKQNVRCVLKNQNINNILIDYLKGVGLICMSSIVFTKKLLLSENIFFDENTYYSEDREFIVKALLLSKKINVIPDILFNYLYREDSAMRKAYSIRNTSSVEAMLRVKIFTASKSNNNKLNYYANINFLVTYLLNLKSYLNSQTKDPSIQFFFESQTGLLKKIVAPKLSKFSIYVFIMQIAYKVNTKLFIYLLKKI